MKIINKKSSNRFSIDNKIKLMLLLWKHFHKHNINMNETEQKKNQLKRFTIKTDNNLLPVNMALHEIATDFTLVYQYNIKSFIY